MSNSLLPRRDYAWAAIGAEHARMRNSLRRLNLVFSPALLVFALTACDQPPADKPTATVGSAKPTTAATTKASAAPAKAAGNWTVKDSSTVGFVGYKLTGSHEGGFKKVSGSAKLAGGKAEGGSVSVEIDMASLFSDSDKLSEHLKGKDFFEVEAHPKTKFTSTEIKAGGDGDATHTITGNLELHGKTKSITFPATVAVADDSVKVTGEFKINRKDFEIVYKGMPDDLIKDDVLIKLSIDLGKG
jgi:polyisoprenoid-binding protein YceI